MTIYSIDLPTDFVVTSRDVHASVDITKLSPVILAKLALHGLTQKIGDSAASAMADAGFKGLSFVDLDAGQKAKVRDFAANAMQGTIESLVAGEWSERKPGETVEPLVARQRVIFGAWLRANAADVWKAHFKGLDVADRGKALDTFLGEQDDDFQLAIQSEAEDQLAVEAKTAKKLAGLKVAVKLAE